MRFDRHYSHAHMSWNSTLSTQSDAVLIDESLNEIGPSKAVIALKVIVVEEVRTALLHLLHHQRQRHASWE